MLLDSGTCKIYRLDNKASAGDIPADVLIFKSIHWYAEEVVGVTRHYAAMQSNKKVDMLIRIWEERSITTDDYCVVNDEQYKIIQVQHALDEDGLKVTKLSIERLGNLYDIASN